MPAVPNQDDVVLISRIRAGDASAFDELFRQYYPDLVYTANRFVRSESEAEDIVQELFFSLWKRRGNLPEDLSAVGGYLHRSVRNRSLNYLRDQKRIPIDEGELPADAVAEGLPSDNLDQLDLQQRLHQAIDRLPERCRLVFVMSKLEDMSHKDIAAALGISTKTVENQMTRAYRFLREWLSLVLLINGTFW